MASGSLAHSICHVLLKHEQQDGKRIYLRQPKGGVWHEFTWAEVMRQARQVARFLQTLGLKKGAHVAIFSKNCAEWFIADFGISLAGMVNVPLFSNQHENSIEYVLEHAEVKLVFVGKLDKPLETRRYIPERLTTISFDYHTNLHTTYRWSDVLASEPREDIVFPEAGDVYTIIYSSGTSGTPKGAVYTHEAIANYLAIFPADIRRMTDLEHHHLLSYLPLAHVYERSAIELGSLAIACDVSFVESLEIFAENLREVKPTLFAAVPRIWGVFQHKIEQKLPPILLRSLLKIPFLSGFIKNKIKHQLGLQCSRGNISGASHLPTGISDFFDKLGIPIQEGYGQTENFAYATLSLLQERRLGYVGTPRLQVEIKLDDNHELLMKCPCLMVCYYKDKEATKKAFTEDGWLRTGDIVDIDARQRVKILGRLSENFKNQKGEFIAPTPIEKNFSTNPMIEHLCLVGQELESNVLLVSLNQQARKQPKQEVIESLQKMLRTVNTELKSYEKISHILLVLEEWTTENDLLTPTLKVKRRVVEERYQNFIHRAIEQSEPIVWE
ncbi:AMP-binding protein [Legionella nagasakiensis]|uniref:AMP-binding protein n=1 Tax=Legionella nagasakiensis TaxID=535290 RepID=UPI00105433AF|nr:AMP-binding protein [Legionella nagasakiensis]